MTFERKSTFAKRIERAPSFVTKLRKEGRLVLSDDGKLVDVELSLARIAATESGINPGAAERHEQDRKANRSDSKRKTKKTSVDAVEPVGERASFKSISLEFENKSTRLEMQLASGERYRNPVINDAAQTLGNTLRASVERLVDQVAPHLAVIQDPAQQKAHVENEVRDIRKLIKQEMMRAMRAMDQRGDV